MKYFIFVSLLTILTSQAVAQFTNQSAPFYLVLSSRNKTYNGKFLYSCHEGAAIEALCPGPATPSSSNVFYLNTSSIGFTNSNSSLGEPGVLNWMLHGGNFNVSESMSLSTYPTSNVAVPLFEPGYEATYVAFDGDNKMNIQAYIDDTKFPISPSRSPYGPPKAYYRWYVCQTYVGYLYETLAWVMGPHSPENPTCVKVTVKRKFA